MRFDQLRSGLDQQGGKQLLCNIDMQHNRWLQ
jgi:hypothetical protein